MHFGITIKQLSNVFLITFLLSSLTCNHNFAQVIVIIITFLISFSHSVRKMCYERTKNKICHKYFSTFLIPSASFLQPSWILTVIFHLSMTSNVFPSAHYRSVQDEYHVSWVCMASPNCLYIHILHTWHPCSVGLCTLITQHQVLSTTQSHCSILVKKTLLYQQLI